MWFPTGAWKSFIGWRIYLGTTSFYRKYFFQIFILRCWLCDGDVHKIMLPAFCPARTSKQQSIFSVNVCEESYLIEWFACRYSIPAELFLPFKFKPPTSDSNEIQIQLSIPCIAQLSQRSTICHQIMIFCTMSYVVPNIFHFHYSIGDSWWQTHERK